MKKLAWIVAALIAATILGGCAPRCNECGGCYKPIDPPYPCCHDRPSYWNWDS